MKKRTRAHQPRPYTPEAIASHAQSKRAPIFTSTERVGSGPQGSHSELETNSPLSQIIQASTGIASPNPAAASTVEANKMRPPPICQMQASAPRGDGGGTAKGETDSQEGRAKLASTRAKSRKSGSKHARINHDHTHLKRKQATHSQIELQIHKHRKGTWTENHDRRQLRLRLG